MVADDNIAIVRRLYAAWTARDDESGRVVLHEEVKWHPAQDEPETGTVHGIVDVERMLDQWVQSFDDFRIEPHEFIAGDDCVVVPIRFAGRVRGSDSEVAIDEAHVYRLRDRKIVEVWCFRGTEEALAEAGLQ